MYMKPPVPISSLDLGAVQAVEVNDVPQNFLQKIYRNIIQDSTMPKPEDQDNTGRHENNIWKRIVRPLQDPICYQQADSIHKQENTMINS